MSNNLFFSLINEQIIFQNFRLNNTSFDSSHNSCEFKTIDEYSQMIESSTIESLDQQKNEETYTTPKSPMSPSDNQNEQEKGNSVQQMQSFIQSSADLSFPLEDTWSFWFFKNDRQAEWKDNLIKITTVTTVEGFWSVYNHLQAASRITQGCDYLLFKSHIVSQMRTGRELNK